MNAARRHEIEALLEEPAAAPPPHLLEALRGEIPPALPARASAPPAPFARSWARLAAALAACALGAYLLARQHPPAGEASPTPSPAPRVALPLAPAPPVPPAAPSEPTAPTATPATPPAVLPPPAPAASELVVNVTDGAGNPLPGATLTVGGARAPLVTDAAGRARLQVPSHQQVEVHAALEGFEAATVKSLTARAGRRATLDLQLRASPDLVTVTAESPPLDEKRIATGSTVVRWSELATIPTAATAPPAPSSATGGGAVRYRQPYGDMFFRATGTSPFVATAEDRLSTFALGVDTGSYALARRYLRDGHLPPPEAVRVEEFINAFHYGIQPSTGDDFTLGAEAGPSPFSTSRLHRLVRVTVAARTLSAAARRPANLTFVVDVSGSMAQENRLGLVKRSLALLLDELRPEDRVALVVFGTNARVVLEPTSDRAALATAIGALETEGATNTEEGLRLGFDLARRAFRPEAVNRILLCSDGVANVGATGPESILARIGEEAKRGIQLSTVGFGMGNYNDALMERLADEGDGTYAYVDAFAEARKIFVESLTGTLATVAFDAKAQVEWNPRVVERYRLLGYENREVADEKFRDDAVDAGEVGAGHVVTALYEVQLAHGPRPWDRLGAVRVRYRPATAEGTRAAAREVALPLGAPTRAGAGDGSPAQRLAAVVAEFAEMLKRTYWTRGHSFDRLAATARALAPIAGHEAELAELRELIAQASAVVARSPARR